jgi:hypothetical protein
MLFNLSLDRTAYGDRSFFLSLCREGPVDPSNNRSFLARLTSHYDALAMVEDTSKAFFLIAALQVISVLVSGVWLGLVDAAIKTGGGLLVRKNHSRVAAVMLLVLAVITLVAVALQLEGVTVPVHTGGGSLLFALICLWAGARAAEATFKLCGSLSASVPVATPDDDRVA